MPIRQRSPATLASWLNKVLTRAMPHLPLLTEQGIALRRHLVWNPGELETALHALHESVTALELQPLARGETGEADSPALARLRACAERVDAETASFLARSATSVATVAPLIASFTAEFRALEKVVERSAEWLEEMDRGIAARRAATSADVSLEALVLLAERAEELRGRQRLLQDAANSARNVQVLADSLVHTRTALADAVQAKVRRTCNLLEGRVNALSDPVAGGKPSLKSLVAARSDTQIWVAQAVSLLIRLGASRDRLARSAASLRHRCAQIPQPSTAEANPAAGRGMATMVWGNNADTESAALA